MKASEWTKMFGGTLDPDINPLSEIAHRLFGSSDIIDYRLKAIRLCLSKQVGFKGDYNTHGELAAGILRVRCPYGCGEMELRGWGGSFNATEYSYTCPKCGCHIELTMSTDAIGVYPAGAMDEVVLKRGLRFGRKTGKRQEER